MQVNQAKQRLRSGCPVFGCFLRHPSPGLAEFLALKGWDLLVLDAEHGPMTVGECENMVRAIELRGGTPMVRVSANDQSQILRYLDTGAQGIHVPCVESAADAEAAVRAVKFQPMGTRGLAASRAADYGQGQPLADCIEFLNEQTLVVVQIESAKAVDNLEEIVAVGGVDVAFIGPTDLSNSFGLPGNIKHPIVQGAIQRIVDVVLQSDVALGIMVSDGAAALTWLEKGARYITTTLEGLLGASSGTFLNTAREHGVRQ